MTWICRQLFRLLLAVVVLCCFGVCIRIQRRSRFDAICFAVARRTSPSFFLLLNPFGQLLGNNKLAVLLFRDWGVILLAFHVEKLWCIDCIYRFATDCFFGRIGFGQIFVNQFNGWDDPLDHQR